MWFGGDKASDSCPGGRKLGDRDPDETFQVYLPLAVHEGGAVFLTSRALMVALRIGCFTSRAHAVYFLFRSHVHRNSQLADPFGREASPKWFRRRIFSVGDEIHDTTEEDESVLVVLRPPDERGTDRVHLHLGANRPSTLTITVPVRSR